MKKLESLNGMVKAEVVPYYVQLILKYPGHDGDEEVRRFNQLIIDKWSNRALIDIKEQAWSAAKHIKEMLMTSAERGFVAGRSQQSWNDFSSELFRG